MELKYDQVQDSDRKTHFQPCHQLSNVDLKHMELKYDQVRDSDLKTGASQTGGRGAKEGGGETLEQTATDGGDIRRFGPRPKLPSADGIGATDRFTGLPSAVSRTGVGDPRVGSSPFWPLNSRLFSSFGGRAVSFVPCL